VAGDAEDDAYITKAVAEATRVLEPIVEALEPAERATWLDWAGVRLLPALAARERETEALQEGLRHQTAQRDAERAARRALREKAFDKRRDEIAASLIAGEITKDEFRAQLQLLDVEIARGGGSDSGDGEEEVVNAVHEVSSDNDDGSDDNEGEGRDLPTIRVTAPATKRKRTDISEPEVEHEEGNKEIARAWKRPDGVVRHCGYLAPLFTNQSPLVLLLWPT
jgi:hypothetical protein